jgi:hypothetical protein
MICHISSLGWETLRAKKENSQQGVKRSKSFNSIAQLANSITSCKLGIASAVPDRVTLSAAARFAQVRAV